MGKRADSSILKKAAGFYENSTVRRLGYLLEKLGFERQSESLEKIASKAKSFKLLNPSVDINLDIDNSDFEKDTKWKLLMTD